jgi:hypothetical protein
MSALIFSYFKHVRSFITSKTALLSLVLVFFMSRSMHVCSARFSKVIFFKKKKRYAQPEKRISDRQIYRGTHLLERSF